MATFTAIRNKKQTAGALRGVLSYVARMDKTGWAGGQVLSGHNCLPATSLLEMALTKERFHKMDGRQFFHFVQSFTPEDGLTPWQVNAIGLELARREFPDCEVVVATHVDTNHLHNHLVVNSVSCADGRKLHQNAEDLLRHRQANDALCMAHGLSILEPPLKHRRKRRMTPGEYQAELREDSWTLDLIRAVNEALEYADDRESFLKNMEQEGYQVTWTDTRKHVTFTCPNGRKCRDSSLHDETFLKENLETLFAYRQAVGFRTGSGEPETGWLGAALTGLVALGATCEGAIDQRPLPALSAWTDSKQRRREALKKLALGQKLSGDQGLTMQSGF